ncbi:ARF-like protein [Tieghemostelium lacteum]|uniref:ARF-like protein n=1 Tax=Tieghemostelium lacteum TaxID=361077 RepID=A0A151ZA60_TIELA|nr:ARF-like protein [Tieghemostelium lacteum]|eukprot:KYQ90836.1 ARF-like protein [Tieghemostelium lacteum]
MFSLFYGLWKYMFQKSEYFILILGLDGAGKTTLLEAIKTRYTKIPGLSPSNIIPTVGLNIGKILYEGVKLVFWDLGGQLQLRSIWDKYYADVHAVIYIVDSSDKERFKESKDELEMIIGHDKLKDVPILLFFNKQDLPNAESIDFLSSLFQSVILKSTASSSNSSNNNNSSIVSSSNSQTSINIQLQSLIAINSNSKGLDDGIKWLVDNLKKNARIIENEL